MAHQYECCYHAGRQFVFVERRRWRLSGMVVTAITGFAIGLSVALAIIMAGVVTFELCMLIAACIAASQAYTFSFRRDSATVDVQSYAVAIAGSSMLLALLLCGVRWSQELVLGPLDQCALFGGFGLIAGVFGNLYTRLCTIEDERKHHLGPCDPDGEPCTDPVKLKSCSQADLVNMSPLERFLRFTWWIASWQWWVDLQHKPIADNEEVSQDDCITVHNHSLKQIKVCFYAPDDMFCWIPYGGVAGRCVGILHPQECRPFWLRRRRGSRSGEYQLKIFQPGFFDKELAFHLRVHGSEHYAFCDVEGMVRRSRLLSSAPVRDSLGRKAPEASWISETSEDEPMSLASSRRGSSEALAAWPAQQALPEGGSGSLHKSSSSGSLIRRCQGRELLHDQDSCLTRTSSPKGSFGESGTARQEGTLCSTASSRIEGRKAALDEVVVRNRSNQEIRACLYRSNDYCYMVPLVGKLLACGDCILPDAERRFNLTKLKKEGDRDFTLKVYSTGSGAKELTYLTVSCGNTYTFCDSLLS